MKKTMTILASLLLASTFLQPVCCRVSWDSIQGMTETCDDNKHTRPFIVRDSSSALMMTDAESEATMEMGEIKTFTAAETLDPRGEKTWADNPQAARYVSAPNGYGTSAGETFYQNILIFYNQFVIGVTDHFSIGTGLAPLFLFSSGATPIWITPKFSVPLVSDRLNVGAGVLAGAVIGQDRSGFGFLYGTSTIGTKDNNLSLGLGYGYVGGSWTKEPLINLSFILRASAKNYIISENYYIPGHESSVVLISVGGRSMTRDDIGIDYGLVIPYADEMDSCLVLPWLGLTVPIRRGRR